MPGPRARHRFAAAACDRRRSIAPGAAPRILARGKIWIFCTFWVPVVGSDGDEEHPARRLK